MPTIPTRENRGLLPAGTKLKGFGSIVRQSDTAYLVEFRDGVRWGQEWLSFDQVHGRPAPVLVPLVVVR